MRKSLTILAAAAASLTLVATGPVDAKRPERGDQVMVLNVDLATNELGQFGCPNISWFGTIELDETTYGMALYPLPGRYTGQDTIQHYEEGWKVWTGTFAVVDGSLEQCEPGEVVLAGLDTGTASLRTGLFRSNGTVDEAHAPFTQWQDRRVHQDGVIAPTMYEGVPVLAFDGDLRLN